MKNITLTVVTILIMLSLIFSFYVQNRTIKDLKKPSDEVLRLRDSLYMERKDCDSLRSEIFIKDIDLGRYEYILDRLDEELSKDCREQLEKIESQTE